MGKDASNAIVPVLGGLAAGTAAVVATQKWSAHTGLISAGTAAAGLAAMTMAKQPWLRQVGAGAVVGAAVVGAVPTIAAWFHKSAPPTLAQGKPGSTVHRMAQGDGYVTRQELNDALGQLADSHKETQKQQTCDLLTALRDEIKKVVAEGPNGPGLPAPESAHAPALPARQPQYTYPFVPRAADGEDDYTRNAYGDDMRDAGVDDYERNAYGDDIRDAALDDYERNWSESGNNVGHHYGDDERNAYGDDERDAYVDDERNGGDDDDDEDDDSVAPSTPAAPVAAALTPEHLQQIQRARSMM